MNLQEIGNPGRLSHAYIVSSTSQEKGYAVAMQLASMAVCSGTGRRPCGTCRDCRKAEKNIHPDIVTITRPVDDKGKQKKFISVDQIRDLKVDALVSPNEAERKVYIIREAEKMNTEAQNAALKLLEEPPKGVIIILCAENAKSLLVTVRSRCKEIVCNTEADGFEEATEKMAKSYFRTLASNNRLKLAEFCYEHDSINGQDMLAFAECVMAMATDMLCGRKKQDIFTAQELMKIYRIMEDCSRRLQVNTSPKLLLGMLMASSIKDR